MYVRSSLLPEAALLPEATLPPGTYPAEPFVARSKQVCIEWMEATVLFPLVSMDSE